MFQLSSQADDSRAGPLEHSNAQSQSDGTEASKSTSLENFGNAGANCAAKPRETLADASKLATVRVSELGVKADFT